MVTASGSDPVQPTSMLAPTKTANKLERDDLVSWCRVTCFLLRDVSRIYLPYCCSLTFSFTGLLCHREVQHLDIERA